MSRARDIASSGVTSANLALKAPLASPAFTGTPTGITASHITTGTLPATVGITALVGTIAPHSSASLPAGWLNADGSAVSRTTYSVLFGVISTTWGVGDGSSTFNLPDCDAAFLRGTGTSAGFAVNPTIALVTKVNDGFQNHAHEAALGGAAAGWVAEYSVIHTNSYQNSPPGSSQELVHGARTGRDESETRPNSIGVNYIIKYI